MEEWMKYPTAIHMWPNDIDYVLCIDENMEQGNTPFIGSITLTGVVIDKISYKNLKEDFDKIKKKYWQNGRYKKNIKGMDAYIKVVFHSREIRRKQAPFNITNYDDFIMEITNVMKKSKYKICYDYIYNETLDDIKKIDEIYIKGLDCIVKIFFKNIRLKSKKAIILIESRDRQQDLNNHKYLTGLVGEYGEIIKGIYFNSKVSDITREAITGIELADLVSFPIHAQHRIRRDYSVIKDKIIK